MKPKIMGFTLIELSIVIVIIGLIVAGVTAGQSLIRQAQLRDIMTGMEQIKLSVNTFRVQYNAFPGDMKNAESFWGTEGSLGDSGTVNGNGNNLVTLSFISSNREGHRVWEHLALATMFNGDFPGCGIDESGTLSTGSKIIPGMNAPESLRTGVGYGAGDATKGITITIGKKRVSGQAWRNTAAGLTPVEASQMDQKNDDGIYNNGILQGSDGNDGVTTTTCISGGSYDLTVDNELRCSMTFDIQ